MGTPAHTGTGHGAGPSRWHSESPHKHRWVLWGATAVAVLLIVGIVVAAATQTTTSTSAPSRPIATPPPAPPVSLTLSRGDYSVTTTTTVISGTVTAGSAVTVNGKAVPVDATGAWHTTVHLDHGGNPLAINATLAGHPPGSDTITVTRNLSPAEVQAQKQAAAAYAQKQAAEKQAAAQRAAAEKQAAADRAAAAKQNYMNGAVTIPYAQLNKSADSYTGKVVTYTGQILQVQEDRGGGGMMLVSVTNDGSGFWTDNIWVDYTGHVSGAQGDQVTFWGKVVGSKSYDTQAGGNTYVPQVTAKYVNG
jgi:hypothetical protein